MGHCCHCDHTNDTSKRGCGLFATLAKLVVLWIVLVFGSGTLINSGYPVAVETGRLIRVVTFVDPLIRWAESNHAGAAAYGLRVLANGAPV
jgi:hypothetical protein